MQLHSLAPKKGSTRPRKRVGRGLGSTGSYSGRGIKGQRARSGGKRGLKLLGLRPIMLQLPKQRGFKSLAVKPQTVNVGVIAKTFADGAVITLAALQKHGLIAPGATFVKVLGDGAIGIKVHVKGCVVSKSAQEKIVKAGGAVQPVV